MNNPQNIMIISAVYPPEPQVSARMSFDLANYFADERHCVTVLCPQPSRPLKTDYSQYLSPNASIVTVENRVKVVRLPSFAAPESRFLPRMWESFSFGREVKKYLANEEVKPDVLYVNSWPLFAQAIIARFTKKSAVPMVIQIMDIYPEALTSKLPAFLRSVIHAPLKKLDAWIVRSASTVVVISENMRRTYTESRRIPVEFVVTIPTWQDETVFENIPPRTECCSRYGIPQHPFTFLFLGNIGPVAGVDFLIRAFNEANIPNAQLLIVGDGAAKSDCVKLVKLLNLSRVHFISDSDVANVPILQRMAHVCMLPMKRGAGMSSIPSKLSSYLFSAKPVIATVDSNSDTASFVRQAECGWVGEAEDLNWLANKMKEVAQLSMEQLESVGQQGKRFGLMHFSKSSGVVRLANTIIQAAGVNV
jgi:glycosyltransferase involved in cell wall biosynthesis